MEYEVHGEVPREDLGDEYPKLVHDTAQVRVYKRVEVYTFSSLVF